MADGPFYLASDVDARIAELEKALLHFAGEGIRAVCYSGRRWEFRDSGCGCCSGPEDLPADIDATIRPLLSRDL